MTATDQNPGKPRMRVVIAGGGIAALETAFALRALAGQQVAMTLLSPGGELRYRPMSVGEPFTAGHAQSYPIARLAHAAGAVVIRQPLTNVDPDRRVIRVGQGTELGYDALVIATGAGMEPSFEHATPFDDARADELIHGLVQDVEGGYVSHLAIVVPAPPPWPLPAYELALLASERAWNSQLELKVTVVTPETSPLSVFGPGVSDELTRLLGERKIEVLCSAFAEVPNARSIVIHPGGRTLEAQRIIALPTLSGPAIPGLPQDGLGFIPIDERAGVRGVEHVWVAGDASDFPLKFGGVAAQMADTVAQAIAANAGAGQVPPPFAPSLEGVLLTGGRRRRLRGGWPTGGAGVVSEMTVVQRDVHLPKIATRYLQAHLTEPLEVPAVPQV